MELDLVYTDYTMVGLTRANTLKSLQISDTKHLRISVGDQDGVLQVFSVKNDEIQLNFKTLPGEPITSLDVGVSQGSEEYDKIFVSSGTEIRGYTKKGKLFLGIETNLSEPIIAMKVFEADLLVTGAHCMTHYRDCKDIGSYISGDTIINISAIQIQNSNRVIGIIACRGGTIHAIERGRVLAIVRLPSGPSLLFSPFNSINSDYVLCGGIDGSLYRLSLDREHGSIDVHNYEDIQKVTSITTAGWWNGSPAHQNPLLLLGYSYGCIQIYNFVQDADIKSLRLLFTYNCDESITSVAGWSKGVIIATCSGRIFGLLSSIDTSKTSIKINKLREEIRELENQVEKERSHYHIATQPLSQGISAIPALQISEIWGPVEADGARNLCISLGAPLDILLLQSMAPLRLFDTAPNTALLTNAFQMKGTNVLLATYRCQANTQQLEMRIGIWIENVASGGELCVYVTPLLQPKCSQFLKYYIHPLLWHVPIEEKEIDCDLNSLIVTGAFSKAEIHAWLNRLLPEMPPRPLSAVTTLMYRSATVDTILRCSYLKGEAEFKSDNISTISTIKDFLSEEATKKKIKLDISCNVNNKATINTITKIHPKIWVLFKRSKELKTIDALRQLQIEGELQKHICDEYVDLLKQSEIKKYEKCLTLEQFYDIITNLFIDHNKLKGMNTKNKVPELKATLENYNIDDVISFFKTNMK